MRWLVVGCLLSGCGLDTCNSLDIECFIQHLSLLQGGSQVPLVQVKQSSIERSVQPGTKPSIQPSTPDLATRPLPPSYTQLGCYQDQDPARDLDGGATWSATLTIDACAQKCAGFVYFGLQDGNWCYCGNQFGRYGSASQGQCNFPCAGNTSQLCGGYLRNEVYQFNGVTPPDLGVAKANDLSSPQMSTVFSPTMQVDVMQVTMSADRPAPINIAFTDPNGCTPTLCFGFCSSSSRCSGTRLCTHTLRDGLLSGNFTSALKPNADPGNSAAADLLLEIDSFGSPDCGDFPDLVQQLEQSGFDTSQMLSMPAAGDSATITAIINKSGGNTGAINTGGNAQCSGYTSCSVCNYRSCAAADALGNCSSYYETQSGQRFTCATCSDCNAAATAVVTQCCK
jgi:hypothetical protein